MRRGPGGTERRACPAAWARIACFAAMALAGPTAGQAAGAQLAAAGGRAHFVGGGGAALVRGFAAVAANPAGLAMPGAPRWSLSIAPLVIENGIGPIGLADLARAGGKTLAASTKEDWLERVSADGGQSGPLGAAVTWAAFSVGQFGFQVSTQGASRMDVDPSLLELALYGNAGRTGSPSDIRAEPSEADAWAVSTAGLAYALPFAAGNGDAAFGAAVKYSMGHAGLLLDADRAQSSASPLVVSVRSPIAYATGGNVGAGFGLDLGFQYESGSFAGGVAVQNVFNTFAWDDGAAKYRPVVAELRGGEFDTDLAVAAVPLAPAALARRWADMTFMPSVSAAAAYRISPSVRLSADARGHLGDGMRAGPKFSAGGGAEWLASPAVSLNLGGAAVSGGFEFGGGGIVSLGAVEASVSGGWRKSDAGEAVVFMAGLAYAAH